MQSFEKPWNIYNKAFLTFLSYAYYNLNCTQIKKVISYDVQNKITSICLYYTLNYISTGMYSYKVMKDFF